MLTVLLFRSDHPMTGARDDDSPIQDHDLIERLGMPRIEGDRDPSRHQACNGRDGGMMRLCVGIEEDMDLDAPLMGTHQLPRQPRRIQDIWRFEVSEPVTMFLGKLTPLAWQIGPPCTHQQRWCWPGLNGSSVPASAGPTASHPAVAL
jgi:hypothetical protein